MNEYFNVETRVSVFVVL